MKIDCIFDNHIHDPLVPIENYFTMFQYMFGATWFRICK